MVDRGPIQTVAERERSELPVHVQPAEATRESHAVASSSRVARVALAHDWLVARRGGEHVLERLAGLIHADHLPAALYTLFDGGVSIGPSVDAMPKVASLLQRVPGASGRLRRWMLPLYPLGVRALTQQLALDHQETPIDLLISTSSAAVKGIQTPDGVPHLCYCHSPARYVWSLAEEYRGGGGPGAMLRRAGLRAVQRRYRHWDRETSRDVTRFVANSEHTAALIRRCYAREADVVHPPVRTNFYTRDPFLKREPFWLFVGALEPYKRADLAIRAAAKAKQPLVIVGEGTEMPRLRAMAGRHVRFMGRVDDETVRDLYRRAQLLLFPQLEDFGIVAVEAQACGCPVVARRAGGALDTVIEGQTGVFFEDPTPEAVAEAAKAVPANADRDCRAYAESFSEARFDEAMRAQIESVLG